MGAPETVRLVISRLAAVAQLLDHIGRAPVFNRGRIVLICGRVLDRVKEAPLETRSACELAGVFLCSLARKSIIPSQGASGAAHALGDGGGSALLHISTRQIKKEILRNNINSYCFSY